MPTPEEELQAQVAELNEKLSAEIENAQKQRQAKQALQAQLDESQAERDRLAAEKAEADAEAERVKLESEGKYQEALEAERAQQATVVAGKDTVIGTLSAALQAELGTNRLTSALGEAGVKSELLSQASQLLASRVKVSLKDDKPTVEVFDEAGQPMLVDGNPATISDLVGAWTSGNPHFFPPSGDHGSGAHKGAATGKVTYEELQADPNKLAEFLKQSDGAKRYHQMGVDYRRRKRAEASA